MKLNIAILITIIALNKNQILSGQNYQDLQKLQNQYKEALKRQELQKPDEISDAEKTAKSTALPDKLIYSRKDIESLLANTEKLLDRLEFFEDSVSLMPYVGYEVFTKRDTIPFWQNLPIPKDYILGPGDEIIISLWGETDVYDTKTINRDGQVYIQNIGILNLGGKSIIESKSYILSKYSRVYSTLLGNNPKSFIDLTLGELKSVNVHFVGFVNMPGVHMIHPFSNIITGLIQAGGVNNKGSLRDIQVLRNNEVLGKTDLYNYLFNGKSLGDVRLMDQDIIYIPPRLSTIPITGSVLTPGYYELTNNDLLNDLIKIAGGKNRNASSTVFVYRHNNKSDDTSFLLNENQTINFKLFDGDSIHVPIRADIKKIVRIEGQIKNPGEYPYSQDMTLNDLINATMTINDKDFIITSDLSSIIVNRKNPSEYEPLKFVVDLEKQDFLLLSGDNITVPPTRNNQTIESVIVTGEINIPGIFPVNNLTTLSAILDLSGGFSDNAIIDGIEIFRDSLKVAWEDYDFILQDGDSLNVLKKSGLILVMGEVNQPGYVSYKKGDSVKKYINRAGGYSAYAEKKDIFIIHPNGNAIPKTSFSSPKVLDGSTIVVNQQSLSGSNRVGGLDAFRILSSQAGNIATTVLSIAILLNQSSSN